MASIPTLLSEIASSSHCCSFNNTPRHRSNGKFSGTGGFLSLPEASHCSRRFSTSFSSLICCAAVNYYYRHLHRSVARKRWRVIANSNATAFRVLDAHVNGHTSNLVGVEIPVSCYQVYLLLWFLYYFISIWFIISVAFMDFCCIVFCVLFVWDRGLFSVVLV